MIDNYYLSSNLQSSSRKTKNNLESFYFSIIDTIKNNF